MNYSGAARTEEAEALRTIQYTPKLRTTHASANTPTCVAAGLLRVETALAAESNRF